MAISLQNYTQQFVLTPTTAATTTRSASFDFLGADYAKITVLQSASAGTNGGLGSVSLLTADSVPSQATQFATIVANLGTQATLSHQMVYLVDCKTAKRYGKVIITPNTNTNDSIITAVTLELARLEQVPSNTAAMVSSTNDSVTIV